METIEQLESNVRSYVRSFPTVFVSARGHVMIDRAGKEYIDFFAGAGTLNYGHNNPRLREALLSYLSSEGITHSLDMATGAKIQFLETLNEVILQPRKMYYKVMFPGPTGTNAVESALKLARKVTGRTQVIAFTNGFHGMTLGSLALTCNGKKRRGAGVTLSDVTHAPYDGYLGEGVDTAAALDRQLSDPSGGLNAPAAIVVETVQGEGGINVASAKWLRKIQDVARKHGALLVLDDIQVGCGRTGPFFSFEEFGLDPDLICLSKSLSGYGFPFAILLLKGKHDIWEPGEHNGTFRGFNPAMVTATTALKLYWSSDELSQSVKKKGELIRERLGAMASRWGGQVRGRGLVQGLALPDPSHAGAISAAAFRRGLIAETSGSRDQVLKLLPPLTLPEKDLMKGLDILEEAAGEVVHG